MVGTKDYEAETYSRRVGDEVIPVLFRMTYLFSLILILFILNPRSQIWDL